ncbi:MAG: T9SS type A sorting domain-containing protein [bacterium]
MKLFLITSILLSSLSFNFSFSQELKKETLAINGGSHFVYGNNKSYFIQESIGQQSVINVFETENYQLRQGFLQPIDPSFISNGADDNLLGRWYPNPFIDHINLIFDEPLLDVVTISLYDVIGRQLFLRTYNPAQEIRVSLENLANGSYLLVAQMRSQQFIAKLVKR